MRAEMSEEARDHLPNSGTMITDSETSEQVRPEDIDLARRPHALHQPRDVVAGVQRPGARGGPRRAQPAARAAQVHRDLRDQPRRVLHDPGRGSQAADRGRGPHAFRRRAPARRTARGGGRPAAAVAGGDDELPRRRTAARAWPRTGSGSSTTSGSSRPCARRWNSTFTSGSSPCSRRWRSMPAIRSRTSRTLSLSLAVELRERRASGDVDYIARVKVPPSLPRFVPIDAPAGQRWFVLLEDVIAHNLQSLFPGMTIRRLLCLPRHPRRRPRPAGRRSRRSAARDRIGAAQTPLRRAGAARVRKRNAGRPARDAARRALAHRLRRLRHRRHDGDVGPVDAWSASTSRRCTNRRSRRRFRAGCAARPISSR